MDTGIIISEGNTTNEAIEKGLKILKASKDQVEIKVLENEDKRSFFSILTPRVVKVELRLKENRKKDINSNNKVLKEVSLTEEEQIKAQNNINEFLKSFFQIIDENTQFDIIVSNSIINVNINNNNLGFLIGYRGETLYSLQSILNAIAAKGLDNRPRVILNIGGYKEKRQKTLEDLADKIANTVVKVKKSITLEPMQAYERKIIHSRLQGNDKVETQSIGEEPRRRIVVSLKKK